jgi:SAM-dependent methyltransferase
MDRPVDTEDTNRIVVRKIIRELEYYNFKNNGLLLSWYYKLEKKSCSFQGAARKWEYIWSITNSKFRAGERVLDAGCGNSPLLFYFYNRGCFCCGVDNKFSFEIYPPSAYSLRRKIVVFLFKSRLLSYLINFQYHWGLSYSNNAFGYRIHYIKGDMSDMPFAGSSFDHIFCNSVIEHLSREEMISAAQEFKRLLKTGGFLIATIDCFDVGLLWRDFIEATGLKLCGEPASRIVKNACETVGFILQKQ